MHTGIPINIAHRGRASKSNTAILCLRSACPGERFRRRFHPSLGCRGGFLTIRIPRAGGIRFFRGGLGFPAGIVCNWMERYLDRYNECMVRARVIDIMKLRIHISIRCLILNSLSDILKIAGAC